MDDVVAFAREHIAKPRTEITPATRLVEDLRIVGDDAEELLKAIQEEFDVTFSGMSFGHYFPDEATASMYFVLSNSTLE